MTNTGTTRSSVAHLIDALVDLAVEFEEVLEDESPFEKKARERAVLSFTEKLPPLPDFSGFHPRFRSGETPEGDMRTAYFLGTEEDPTINRIIYAEEKTPRSVGHPTLFSPQRDPHLLHQRDQL